MPLMPPDHIRQITPYEPGKPIEEVERELGLSDTIKLASNENPLGPSPLAIKAVQRALPGANRYPDGGGYYLRRALAEREETLRKARFLPPEEAALARTEAYAKLGPSGLPLPPIVDFDVLFIPDSADKVSLIAPGLAYHEIRGVGLLGTSEWLDQELLDVARRHVSGSVISTPFYPQSDLPFVAEFVAAFRQTFGEEPDSYAAQAFDAANLILVQLAAGKNDRGEIRDGLLQMHAYPGATGVLSMRPDGNARRRPFLLGVKGRRFVPLD